MTRPLRLEPDEPEEDDGGRGEATRDELVFNTIEQTVAAEAELDRDYTKSPRVPWDSLHNAVGYLLPYHLWVWAAMSGNGKSTLLMSLTDSFAHEGRRVYVLPLETKTEVQRTYWAALSIGVDPNKVLRHLWGELPGGTKDRLKEHLAWQRGAGEERVHFSDRPRVGIKDLRAIWDEAKAFGADVVMIDHLHRLETDGRNPHHSLVALCQGIKELAKGFEIPCLAAAQLNREAGKGNPLAPFMPPLADHVQGGKVVEQECDVLMGVYRPLAGQLTKADLMDLQLGTRNMKEFLEPNCIGVNVMKHRLNGADALRQIVKLHYEKGHISCQATRQRLEFEERHGI